MGLKSRPPVYAIVLLTLSTLFMAATFLPFLYSILSPNEDIERFVAALKDRGEAPLEADNVVEQTKGAVGSLTRVIQIGYYSGGSIGLDLSGSRATRPNCCSLPGSKPVARRMHTNWCRTPSRKPGCNR